MLSQIRQKVKNKGSHILKMLLQDIKELTLL